MKNDLTFVAIVVLVIVVLGYYTVGASVTSNYSIQIALQHVII
jgi:hypothetical protein